MMFYAKFFLTNRVFLFFCSSLQYLCILWGIIWDNLNDDVTGYCCWSFHGYNQTITVYTMVIKKANNASNCSCLGLFINVEYGTVAWLE